MWVYNSNFGKWSASEDSVSKTSFDILKQELSATRFYSRILSGATFIPVNDLDNIYDILGEWEPRNWFVNSFGSKYSETMSPTKNSLGIIKENSYDYYTKFIAEYGLTLKTLFTPDRLIKDSLSNYYYVDVATTEKIDFNNIPKIVIIDGVLVRNGHKVLIKDQKTTETITFDIDPETYFKGPYTLTEDLGATKTFDYFNNENGIYTYDGKGFIKDPILDDYSNCVRYSVNVKMGEVNTNKQFHLRRLLNGYYPTSSMGDPMAFAEKHNWMLRNRVDYNNLFEINYYDVIKHGPQSYNIEGITYSIPERTIAIGEFGVILNTQNLSGLQGTSNIINNKYKVNLRSISQTSTHYWICGDDSTLLKVRKHDFLIERSVLDTLSNLNSISFYNDLRGVVVGDFNTIFVTTNGGVKWSKLKIADFAPYTYNKVIFTDINRFYIGGRNGVFLEMFEDQGGWTAFKRRIFKEIDDDDEYLLVESINDLYKTTIDTWNLGYSFGTQTIATKKEIMFIATNNNNLIAYDMNDATEFDFIYLDFGKKYGDIRNITRQSGTNNFYFTAKEGLYSFDINNFASIGVGNTFSNTVLGSAATLESTLYANEIFDHNGGELIIAGNNSLLKTTNYGVLDFKLLDEKFEDRLKSKLLFMDYDIGAKLNWFTDQGDYRLPNSTTFNTSNIFMKNLDGTLSSRRGDEYLYEMGFGPIVHGATSPSMMTQSECNWLTYWIDEQKTFEYYSEYPLNDYEVTGITGSMVLISTTFSHVSGILPSGATPGSTEVKKNKINLYKGIISNDNTAIEKLAPSFAYTGTQSSRYDKLNRPNISAPSDTDPIKLYLRDYLMILKIPNSTYSYKLGDVVRIESGVIDANFVVNKIWVDGIYSYVYMYSNFNQSIISDLIVNAGQDLNNSKVTITNLNNFNTVEELVYNFNQHPIGNAYKMQITASYSRVNYDLKISPKFSALTSYYNLATNVYLKTYNYTTATSNNYTKEMIYTSGFLKFGYTATYNLLDYLESINKINNGLSTFYASKEYLAMPIYKDIPLGSLGTNNIYIDYNGITQSSTTGNKIMFGEGLKLEWESILINTFVDVSIYQPDAGNTFTTERLLVMHKYKIENIDNIGLNTYVIEFHKKLNFELNTPFNDGTIDIISRRSLLKISEDLQELNNIHKARLSTKNIVNDTFGYKNYQRELNFKVPTDSYAKIFLSDVDTVDSLTAIMYIDYKNELAMNITRLDRDYNLPITNTVDFNGELFISCSEKHMLSNGDGVVLEFNGGPDSSQELNQNYFGYRVVKQVYGEYDFTVDLPYGNDVFVGADTGYVRYVKKDPFLNYQPVDLIDIGVDKKGHIAIELGVENTKLKDGKFQLVDVDYSKYRFRLVDGMNVETLSINYPWIFEAEVSGAVIGLNNDGLVWYKGIWEGGRWFGGTWISGSWKMGDWYGGTWNSKMIKDRLISVEIDEKSSDVFQSTWYGGRWYDGTWNNGTWINGRFYDGNWNNGIWNNGTWNDGIWNYGKFIGGIWVTGTWNGGIFNTDNEPAYWIDGVWNGGDFENGMWYNGSFESKNNESRFGTKAFNSRTATWHGGKWLSGSFFSKLGTMVDVSEVHKYSIWRTGQWVSGNFYGGVVYNIDFKSGTWHGGVLEDIQIIGINENNNSFILNGIFKFNIGDEFYVLNNNIDGELSKIFGSNDDPKKYTVLYTVEDSVNKFTEVYVATNVNEFSGNYVSYRRSNFQYEVLNPNSIATSTIITSDAKETVSDVKVRLNIFAENKSIEKYAPVAQFIYSSPIIPQTTSPYSPQNPYPGVPIENNSAQTNFFSQNLVGCRLSNAQGSVIFSWGMTPIGYSGTGFSAPGTPLKYVLNATMSTTYGSVYIAKERVLDTVTGDEISSVNITSNTVYSLSDEIYGYRIDVSEDHLFETYFAQYEVGNIYSYTINGLTPNKYYYFRVMELRSSGIGGLKITLTSPSGQIIGIKEFNEGNDDTDMRDTVFTYNQSFPKFDTGKPVYEGKYRMNLNTIGKTCEVLTSEDLTEHSLISKNNYANFTNLLGTTQYVNGNWTISIENTSGINTGYLYDWEIQFGYTDTLGAQLNDRKNAVDTGLRVVSTFNSANWKTGIWTNGVFNDGLFEAGIWYNGIFNGTWG